MLESEDQTVKSLGTQLESQLDVSEDSAWELKNSSTAFVRLEPPVREVAIDINIKSIEIPKNHLAISRDCLLRLSIGEISSWLGVDAPYTAPQFESSLTAIPLT